MPPTTVARLLVVEAASALPIAVPQASARIAPETDRSPAVLLVETDQESAAVNAFALTRAGFRVSAAAGPAAMRRILAAPGPKPALIVLDTNLGQSDEADLVAELRGRCQDARILLVGRGDEDARVRALEAGANAWAAKPISPRELVARIRALLQPFEKRGGNPSAPAEALRVGPLTLDPLTHTAAKGSEPLHLTPTEFRLLHCLMANAGAIMEAGTLLREVWGHTDPRGTDVLRTTVHRLRRKLDAPPSRPQLLHCISGIGLLLKAGQSDAIDAGH